jgi:hypothetical protein
MYRTGKFSGDENRAFPQISPNHPYTNVHGPEGKGNFDAKTLA